MSNVPEPASRRPSAWLTTVAVVVFVTAILLALARAAGFPDTGEDSDEYRTLALGQWSAVHQPFSARFLHPMLVRLLTRLTHASVDSTFSAVAVVCLPLTVLALAVLSRRARMPVLLLIPATITAAFVGTVRLTYMPDLFYTLLLAGFLLLLAADQFALAAVGVVVLFCARESTLLLGLTAAATAVLALPRPAGRRVAAGFVAATVAGSLLNRYVSGLSAANVHNVSGLTYMLAKVPYNFTKNVLGIQVWTNTLTHTQGDNPMFRHALPRRLRLGGVNEVGISEISVAFPTPLAGEHGLLVRRPADGRRPRLRPVVAVGRRRPRRPRPPGGDRPPRRPAVRRPARRRVRAGQPRRRAAARDGHPPVRLLRLARILGLVPRALRRPLPPHGRPGGTGPGRRGGPPPRPLLAVQRADTRPGAGGVGRRVAGHRGRPARGRVAAAEPPASRRPGGRPRANCRRRRRLTPPPNAETRLPTVTARRPTVLVVSQTFVPDPASVGQHMADVAFELARRGHPVRVYTSGRGYEDATQIYPRRETLNGADVRRFPLASFGKRSILLRVLGTAVFHLQAFFAALFTPRLGGIFFSTSPPLIGLPLCVVAIVRRVPVAYWAMDLNPDQLIALGKVGATSLRARVLEAVPIGSSSGGRP